MTRIEVAVPRPVFGSFTYLVPDALLRPGEVALPPGSRVRVPFGRTFVTGVALGPPGGGGTGPEPTLKEVADRLDPDLPALTRDLVALARRLAEVNVCPLGTLLHAMLPPAPYRGRGRLLLTARITTEGLARLTEPAPDRPLGRRSRLSGDDRRILALLAVSDGGVPLVRIRRELDLSPGRSFDRLAREGFLALSRERIEGAARTRPGAPAAAGPEELEAAPTLTPDQKSTAAVLARAVHRGRFSGFLLDGVTGSGKTEVYFAAVTACLAAGRGAILLVPEIALAAQLDRWLRRRFGRGIALMHSGLGAAERREAHRRVRRGEAPVVLGARSAVFAPVADLGLVVVDEAHDTAYQQTEAPRYHARHAAWFRARGAGAVLIFGSATPSLELVHAGAAGRLRRLRLPRRIRDRRLASARLVDMRPVLRAHRKAGTSGPPPILSPPLARALEMTAASGKQALVLMNRRGYGGRLLCLRCGEVLECPNCSVALTLHRRGLLAICHACGHGRAAPDECPACGGDVLRAEGVGTERVEEEVARLLPGIRVERFDRDSTRARGRQVRLLEGFRRGRIRVLVGTQMIAKGHDFPDVTLVGVVAADAGLGVPDYRAAERTFQLLTQVSGRAGRGDAEGRVFIQTMNPDHYAVTAAAAQDPKAFREVEMEMRRRFRYPPFVRLVSLTLRSGTAAGAQAAATDLGATLLEGRLPEGVELLGPAPAPRLRAGGKYFWQLLLKAAPAAQPDLRSSLRSLVSVPSLARRLIIHVDP